MSTNLSNTNSKSTTLGSSTNSSEAEIQSKKILKSGNKRKDALATRMNEELGKHTTEDAFRDIKRACEAESSQRYNESISLFVSASEKLVVAAEYETDPRITKLLSSKADEVLRWAEFIANWMDHGARGMPPTRLGGSVAILLQEDSRFKEVTTTYSSSLPYPSTTTTTTTTTLSTSTINTTTYGYGGGSGGGGDGVEKSQPSHPHALHQQGHRSNEFSHLTYTAVSTIRPENFSQDGYRLQSTRGGRSPRMMIVITMYNEDADELSQTLRKVCNNVKYLQDNKLPGYEGEEAWKNILVCIVSDGREKANPETLSFLNEIGLFDEDAMTIYSTGSKPEMHLFEHTIQMNKLDIRSVRLFFGNNNKTEQFPPLQVIFALKEHNAGKLNSHLWYFEAFANQVEPEYTVLLDVGTKPTKSAFFKLLAAMEVNPQVGGVCGEIAVDRPIPNLCNFVIAAQHYEYKISNILDKSNESCYGFISVLPGAFSAYRFEAIRGQPLNAYFQSLTTSMEELGPFKGNMYLAEDRILCFELLAKENCSWTMEYVKDAIARTDVPRNLVDLMAQRRRWLNGSFFAMLYTLVHWGRVYTDTNHSLIRKFFLIIQYIGMLSQTLFSWFLLGNFYLTCVYILVYSLTIENWKFTGYGEEIASYRSLAVNIFNGLYALTLGIQIITGLGNKPKHLKRTYGMLSFFYVLVMILTIVVSVGIVSQQTTVTVYTLLLMAATFGVYFVAGLLHCELHHIILAFFQYTLLLPTFTNVLMIYSFCNIHDLSWGTKGIDTGHADANSNMDDKTGDYKDLLAKKKAIEAQKKAEAARADAVKRKFDSFRSNLLILWLCSNSALVASCLFFITPGLYLPLLFLSVGIFNIQRLIGSMIFLLYSFRQWILFKFCICCGCLERKYKRKWDMHKRTASLQSTHSSIRSNTLSPNSSPHSPHGTFQNV